MNLAGFAVLSVVVATFGCDSPQVAHPVPAAKQPYQRFLPIQPPHYVTEGIPWSGYFALDTKMGRLCGTVKDLVFNKSGPSEWANGVPNCSQLLADNPD